MIPATLCIAFTVACSNTDSPQSESITVEQRQSAIESANEMLQANRTIEALAITSILVEKDTESPESQEIHALTLIAEGWRLEGIGDWGSAHEKRIEALKSYVNACNNSNAPGLLQLSTAQLAHMIGDTSTATTYYKLAHDNIPTDARASFFLAQIAMLDQRWGEAERWVSESLQRNPNEPFAMLSLALIEAELGNTDRAVTLAENGCDIMPDNPNLRFIQARVLRLAGKPAQAMDILLALPNEMQSSQVYKDEIDLLVADAILNAQDSQ